MGERRRLSPEHRREQLLDAARDLVDKAGVGACTVDEVAQHVDVTPQLVHKYFGTRAGMLQQLFEREDDRYHDQVRARLDAASDFEDIVRVFVTANFDELSRGTAIGQLRLIPEVADLVERRRRAGGRSAEQVLVRAMAAEYTASAEATEFVLRLGSAASIEAGNLAARQSKRDRQQDIENTVRFILAGIREIVAEP